MKERRETKKSEVGQFSDVTKYLPTTKEQISTESADVIFDNNRRSEEVQDIVERMPTRWTFYCSIIVATIMVIMIILSVVIEYPDTVSGQVTLTAEQAPIRLVAGSSGRLHLIKKDGDSVERGTIVAYIESGIRLDDLFAVEEIIKGKINMNSNLRLLHGLVLGELSSSYNNMALAYEQFDQLRHTKLYNNMRKSLMEQIDVNAKLVDNLENEITIKNDMLHNAKTRLGKDSVLKNYGALSEEELTSRYNNYLGQLEANVSLRSSHISKESDIKRNRVEMARTDIEEAERVQQAYFSLVSSYNKLANDILLWKERNLFISTIKGKLEYLRFWRENTFVQANQEIFSILPICNTIYGEAYIPVIGAGKIKIGQDVNIKLNDYPYDEYGLVKGRVVGISETTNSVVTAEGTVETYRVKIRLPNGSTTNFGKSLNLKSEAKGQADIITKKKRLMQRLFDNLKSKQEK
jgi:hypothetical protein